MDYKEIYSNIDRFISEHRNEIIELSDYIGMHPELPGKEFETSRMMAEKLKEYGLEVEYPFYNLPTAFIGKKRSAEAGANAPKIAVLVEYDALPEIGHACGHNLHGTMALYAGIALARELSSGLIGEVWVVGTPAEEEDGAKVPMAAGGLFDECDFAIMFHAMAGTSHAEFRILALDGYEFTFTGQTSHAAASPWCGRSAQSGMRLFLDALDMLRLHMKDFCRLHPFIVSVSGATNIIPDKAVCRVETRALERPTLDALMENVFLCAKGAAMATRTEVSWGKFMGSFDDMLPNSKAETLASEVMAKHGVVCHPANQPGGSSDVGNVSYRCPAIQPLFAITSKKFDLHTREMAAATMAPEGHDALIVGAKAMADICLRVMTDDVLRKSIKDEFNERKTKE